MKRSVHGTLFSAFLILVFVIAPVSAVLITESPDTVQRGGLVTVTIRDLNDGASFSFQIDGKFKTPAGERFTFETRQFTMPISLDQGVVSATTQGTEITSFSVKKGTTTVNVADSADANGYFSVSKPYTISSGVYDYLMLEGIARPDTTLIHSTMNLFGTKTGPKDSSMTFTIDGIDNGEVRLIALVNNAQVMYKTVIVGNGIPTPTPTPTPSPTTAAPTTTATTAVTTTQTTFPSSLYVSTAATTETTAPPTGEPTTAATTAAPETTFYSADRKVSLTAQGVDYAGLLMVRASGIPENWLPVSEAYTIAPDSLAFAPPATIAFELPASGAGYAYFIGRYENGQWAVVPSTAGIGAIDGKIPRAGTYALMAYRPESTIPPTATGTAGTATPTAHVTAAGTPKIASIAGGSPPTAVPTRTPLDIVVVTGALAIGVALVVRARQ
jgi:hypothetical protein